MILHTKTKVKTSGKHVLMSLMSLNGGSSMTEKPHDLAKQIADLAAINKELEVVNGRLRRRLVSAASI